MRCRVFAAALLLLLAALPARAAVLFAGGELADFQQCIITTTGNCNVITTAGHFRSGWARESIQVNVVAATDPAQTRLQSKIFVDTSNVATSTGDVWIHFQFYTVSASTQNGEQMIRVLATDGNPAIIVRGTGTSGQVKVTKKAVAGTLTDLVTCTADIQAGLQQIDMHLVYDASGSVDLYRNGVSFCSYSGDVTTDGRTLVNQFELGGITNNAGEWSEVIAATTDTSAMGLAGLTTNANGATVAWTGTNICTAIWAATAYSDASFASAASDNLTHQCEVTDTLPSGTFSVIAVGQAFRGLIGAAGPQHVKFVTRLGGVDYLSADVAPTTTMSNCCTYIQHLNPATAAQWTTGEIPGIELGLKSTP